VGVPAIIFIIVGVIVIYCFCAHYQSRKMRREAIAHRRRSRRERLRQQGDSTYLAPPPYNSANSENKVGGDTELPGYSAVDPYASSTNPQVISDTSTTPGNNNEDEEGVENNGNQEEEGGGGVATIEPENRPLLSEDNTQS